MPIARLAYVALLLSSHALACEMPSLPVVREGASGSAVSTLLDVRRYSDAMVQYTQCVQTELAAAGGDATPAFVKALFVARNNRAVDEHKAVTDLYVARIGPLENLRLAEHLGGESKDCLLGSAVVGTGVLNDGAVIFFLRNQQAYLNVLDTACAGLEREGGFVVGNQPATGATGNGAAAQTPLASRVCDEGRIFPYREGSARGVLGCPLGRFYPVTKEIALQILAAMAPDAAEAPGAK